jgi:hypothetical protein
MVATILVGVAATLAVAVACSLWCTLTDAAPGSRTIHAEPGHTLDLPALGEIGLAIPDDRIPDDSASADAVASTLRGRGLTDERLEILYIQGGCAQGATVATIHRAGWPFRALACRGLVSHATTEWSCAWQPPEWAFRTAYYGSLPRKGPSPRPPIPLAVQPLPLAADTFIFSIIFVGLITAPRLALSQLRAAQRRCRTCGYSLAGLSAAACPECGRSLPAPATTQSAA